MGWNTTSVPGILTAIIETQANLLYLRLDGTNAMSANLDAGSKLIRNVSDPLLDQDAATRAWVLAQGFVTTEVDPLSYSKIALDGGQLDNRYFTEAEHLDTSAGAGDSGKPVKLDAAGNIDASMIDDSDIDHGSIGGLSDDDHSQYHTDTRGDIRYYTKTLLDAGQLDNRYFTESEHINTSAGAGDAGKPIKLEAAGKIDSTMLPTIGDFFADGSVPMTGNFDLDGNDIVSASETAVITNSNTNITFHTDGSVNIDGLNIVGPTSGPAQSMVVGSTAALVTGLNNLLLGTVTSALTSGTSNVLIGVGAGQNINTGINNIAIGTSSATALTSGGGIFIGNSAGDSITTGVNNVAIGQTALQTSTNSGANNMTMLGFKVGRFSNGSGCVYIGSDTGRSASGTNNLYIGGVNAGRNSTGSKNILLIPGTSDGTFFGLSSTSAANEMAVGAPGSSITNFYWGEGGSSATPNDITHRGTNAEGTDIAGGDYSIAAGQPTGDADSGSVILKTVSGGAAGTTVRAAVERFKIDPKGSVSVGTAALATDADDGFFYIPSSPGAPTGTPTAKTGLVAMHYDSTNDEFYIYNGSWRSVAVT